MTKTSAKTSNECNLAQVSHKTSRKASSRSAKCLYEGKAKRLYQNGSPDTLEQDFKDDLTAFNNKKHSTQLGKGVLANHISAEIFQRLNKIGIPTHYLKTIGPSRQLIRKTQIIPLEVVVRNVVAGSLCKRIGKKQGTKLAQPLVEYYYKDDSLGDPLVAPTHIFAMDWATAKELEYLEKTALQVNAYLLKMFADIGFRLVDFKVEFGRVKTKGKKEILLADEFSPDNCRLWDSKSKQSYDKDVFRFDKGDVLAAYEEVARRLDVLP